MVHRNVQGKIVCRWWKSFLLFKKIAILQADHNCILLVLKKRFELVSRNAPQK